ncbi:MAG: hypothetical protein E4H01_15420, partial [Lysobacterales bacterium]
GDRVVFVDEKAQVLPADRILVLFIRSLLCQHPGARVVYDLKSSSVVADEIAAAGGCAIMERSGHAFIKRRLMTEGALLGGEVSGHFFLALSTVMMPCTRLCFYYRCWMSCTLAWRKPWPPSQLILLLRIFACLASLIKHNRLSTRWCGFLTITLRIERMGCVYCSRLAGF